MKAFFLTLTFVFAIFIFPAYGQSIQIVTEEFPPYNFKKNGNITGVSTEVVRAALQKANITFKINMYPWKRAYNMALKKENILIYTISRTPAREDLFKWVGEIAPTGSCLFALTTSDIQINTLDDAKKYTIGTVREDVRDQFFKGKGFKNIRSGNSYEQNFTKLLKKRIDLWAMAELVAYHIVKKLGNSSNIIKKVYYLEEVSKSKYYMAFSKNTPDDIVNKVRNALEQLKKDGTVKTIHSKYL